MLISLIPYMIPVLIALVVAMILFHWSGIVRYIPNNRIGIVEQLWSRHGSIAGGFIALNGEAGYRPDVLRGGVHVHPIANPDQGARE